MADFSTGDVNKAKNILTRASGIYRKAEFGEALQLARDALNMLEALPPGAQHDVLVDNAYKRIVECLDRSNALHAAREEIDKWEQVTKRIEGRVDALALRARIAYRAGDLDDAVRSIDEGVKLAQSKSYAAGMASLLRFQADILWIRGETEKAMTVARQALTFYERLDDPEGKARTLNTLSIVSQLTGNIYQSIRYGLQAITILEKLGDRAVLRVVYNNVGESYQNIYAMSTALFYHEQALGMSGDDPLPDLLRNLGVDLVAVGRIDEGLDYLLQAMHKARAIGDKDTVMQGLHSLADTVFGIGQVGEAKALATELLASAQPLNSTRHIIRACLILGLCARAEGDNEEALRYFEQGLDAAQRTTDRTLVWQLHGMMAEQVASSRPDLAAVHAKIATETVKRLLQSIEDEHLREMFRNAPPVVRVLQPSS